MEPSTRLYELLVKNYEFVKQNDGQVDTKLSTYIQGFMEACLLTRALKKSSIESIINRAHQQVFGIDYESRKDLKTASEEWLDIPTHVRQKTVENYVKS